MRNFQIIGIKDGVRRKLGLRSANKPTKERAQEICEEYLDEVVRITEVAGDTSAVHLFV